MNFKVYENEIKILARSSLQKYRKKVLKKRIKMQRKLN